MAGGAAREEAHEGPRRPTKAHEGPPAASSVANRTNALPSPRPDSAVDSGRERILPAVQFPHLVSGKSAPRSASPPGRLDVVQMLVELPDGAGASRFTGEGLVSSAHRMLFGINMASLRWTLLLGIIHAFFLPFVSAATCNGLVGLLASDLAGYAPAQSYCSSKFPLPKVTATFTAPATVTTTTVATSTTTTTDTTVTTTITTSTATSTTIIDTTIVETTVATTTTVTTSTETDTSTEVDTSTSSVSTTFATSTTPVKKRDINCPMTTTAKTTGSTKSSSPTPTPTKSSTTTTTWPSGGNAAFSNLLSTASAFAGSVCSCLETPVTTTVTVTPTHTSSATATSAASATDTVTTSATTTTLVPETTTTTVDETAATTSITATTTTTTTATTTTTTTTATATATATATGTGISCDDTLSPYTSNGETFDITCGALYIQSGGSTLIDTATALSFSDCVDTCAKATGCTTVSFAEDAVGTSGSCSIFAGSLDGPVEFAGYDGAVLASN